MFGFRLTFEQPAFLLLLLALPLFAWFSLRSLSGLGGVRRVLALLLRAVVATGVILALAGMQLVWTSDRVTVMYLLDQSESIPAERRLAMLDYAIQSVRAHRNATREDRAGIIAFGREAAIEIPPLDDDLPELRQLESYLGRTDATNLEAALKLAQAAMPEETARRVVIVTDGNENLGTARALANRLARSGVGIDVVPVYPAAGAEVLVEKVDLPGDIRIGQPFEARIVLEAFAPDERPEPIAGRLRVTRSSGGEAQPVLEEPIELRPGKNVFPLRHTIDQPAPYTYRAEFLPATPDDDSLRENNVASAYTFVRGKGRVLMIEDASHPNQYTVLVDRLRSAEIEVVVQDTGSMFTSLEELQAYDAVILAGTPRSSGDQDDAVVGFSDDQIEMLVRYTQVLGGGILMVGGPEALGAGGWAGTRLEEAMPVNFRIRNTRIQPVGALAMIMHASEMAQGNFWQKKVAQAALESLGPDDYAGVLYWGMAGDQWMWGGNAGMLPVGAHRRAMLAAISRMTPGDMPQFDPAMRLALAGLSRTDASLRHCVIISDGDPADPAPSTLAAYQQAGVTISTVAIAAHGPADSRRLEQIATATGGKYYVAQDGRALPKIYQREARRISRPLIFEPPGGVEPQIVTSHSLLAGLPTVLPRISGFMMTETKDHPLAQVLIRSPLPTEPENSTLLAVWTYGLGRTAVLTTDAGGRWASEWTAWEGYDRLFSQLTRWLMRPSGDTGSFDLATQVRDGQVQVVVTALDQEDGFLNFLEMGASVLDPELTPLPLRMRQTAPGRYVGSFPADRSGSYFLNILPGPGQAPLSAGVNVPYSDEYRVRDANEPLMQELAAITPVGGSAGRVLTPLEPAQFESLLAENTFRGGLPPARALRDAWPWIVLTAACIFFFDVLVRRVALDPGRMIAALAAWRGRRDEGAQETAGRLQSLRQQKERVGQSIERQRAATRYESDGESAAETELPRVGGTGPSAATKPPSQQPPGGMGPDASKNAPSYTERLLEAKRRARRDSDNS